MFWNLVATVFAGLGAAGVALAIRSLTRKRAPKWLIPVFAGLGMMTYQVYIEYTWFDHMASRLPDGTRVVSTQHEQVGWRPWSYVVPQITAFTVLDESSLTSAGPNGNLVTFQLYRFRHSYGGRVAQGVYLANCEASEMVPLDDDGKPRPDSLQKLSPDDQLMAAVCD